MASPAAALSTARLSVAANGTQGNRRSVVSLESSGSAVSGEGRYVVFISDASNLVPGDANGQPDVFVKDRLTGAVMLVSQSSQGVPANGTSCCEAAISLNGRFVAFQSFASNLVAGDTNGVADVFLHDLRTRRTIRVSVATGGGQGNNDSKYPAVSREGRYVTFSTRATNLVPEDANGSEDDILIHDLFMGTTERVSVSTSGAQGERASIRSAISGDGRFVAFDSASSLAPGDTDSRFDIYLRDRDLGTTERVSVPVGGGAADGESSPADISADGNWVVFRSRASNLVAGDGNGADDIFLWHRLTRATVRISVAEDGSESNGDSHWAAVSADGRAVAFSSNASNLVPGDSNGTTDVFLYRNESSLTRVSTGADGAQGDGPSDQPSLRSDGQLVIFSSLATNLVAADTNDVEDVFMADQRTAPDFANITGRAVTVGRVGIAGVTVDAGVARTTTDAQGFFSLRVPEGTHTLQPSRAGFTFGSPAYIAASYTVTVPPDASVFIFGYDRPPIVFVHGWTGAPEDFREVPDRLQDAGYYPELVRLETSVFSTPPLSTNAIKVAQGVAHAKHVTGQPKVILVGHSMGGLVARAYFEGPPFAGSERSEDVAALLTFGSPHQGIPLATSVAAGVGCVVNGPSDAVCEMTPVGMFLFNAAHFPAAGVDYHAVGGDAPMWRLARKCFRIFGRKFCIRYPWPDLRWRNGLGWTMGALILGDDDAFVTTESALAMHPLTAGMDRFVTEEVHDLAFGPRDYFEHDRVISRQGYAKCLEPLLVRRTIGTCGFRSSIGVSPAETAAAEADPGSQVTPPNLSEGAALVDGIVLPGETVTRPIAVEGGPTAFLARWESGALSVTLVDPQGRIIDPAVVADQQIDPEDPEIDPAITGIDPDVADYLSDGASAGYFFPNARPGVWQLVVRAVEVPPAGTRYASSASFESPLRLTAATDRRWYRPGSTARIRVSFSLPETRATVIASVQRSDGVTDSLSLTPAGGGVYEGRYLVPDVPGYAAVRIVASGVTPSAVAFERGAHLDFQITTNVVTLSGSYSDAPEPRPDNPALYQALLVNVGVQASMTGRVGLFADLVDGAGTTVAHAVTVTEVVPGPRVLTLRFRGTDIFASRRNGPYTLTRLILMDHRNAPLVAAEASGVHSTAAYDYRRFAPAPGNPVVQAGGPYSVAEGSSVTLAASGVDPEADRVSFAWDLDGNGTFETPGARVLFSAASTDGPRLRSVSVRATDATGRSAVASTTVDVLNVAPAIDLGPDAGVSPAEAFRLSVSFRDPGPDSWTATVDYGEGAGIEPLSVDGRTVALDKTYARPGSYIVTVTVTDDDGDSGSDSLIVSVREPVPAWRPDTLYLAGALVTYGGRTYQCRQTHTSQIGWEPPNVLALWHIPPPTSVSEWEPHTSYPRQTLVTYGGATYECLQTHTSVAGWEPPNAPALWLRR